MDDFSFYIQAFRELHTERPSSFGVASIPFTAIYNYYKIYGIDEYEEWDEFLYYIRCMDNAWVKNEAEKSKKAQKENKPKGPQLSKMKK